jgi:GT2 family glycosyltransferase
MGICDWVTGAFMFIRHRLIEEVGPFDENYFLYYEDVDRCLQAQKKGWEIYYNPSVSAYHLNPHVTSVRTPFIENEIRKSRQYFFRKNSVAPFPKLFSHLTQIFKKRLPSRSSLSKRLLKSWKVTQQRIRG